MIQGNTKAMSIIFERIYQCSSLKAKLYKTSAYVILIFIAHVKRILVLDVSRHA